MANPVLQELSKEQIVVTKFEEAILTWHENYLAVLSEKGVHVFELTHNVRCLDKKIDCVQFLISHPKYSPITGLFTNRVLNKRLRNVDQTEMIIDHSMWPHNAQLMQEMSVIVDYKWSPPGAVNNYESALAILTNVGVVEIYTQLLSKWQCILRISEILSEEYNICRTLPESFKQLKDATHKVATSAICWSPSSLENSSYFVTAQKNGKIIFWLIESNQTNATAKTVGTLQIDSCEIQSMLWTPFVTGRFLLVCSNILGQIIILECHIQNNIVQLVQPYNIWPHKDKIITKCLEYVEVDMNMALLFNKNRHLLIILFDKECIIQGHYINNINDYRITSICKANNDIYVTTVNCKVHKLNMTVDGKDLNITLDPVEFLSLGVTHELYGLVFSPNTILSALCVSDKKVGCRKEPLKLEIIITSTKEKLNSAEDLLLTNPTKLLSRHWDVIEALRYKCLKAKEIPKVDYKQLYDKAVTDIYMLKVYNIFCTIFDNLRRTFKIGPEIEIPQSRPDNVKEELLVLHADKLTLDYYKKFKEQGKLSPLEIEYFAGAKKFLEHYLSDDKKISVEVLDPNIMSIIDVNTPFTCQSCDEEVAGFKCKSDHLNMFCALTFTPIDTENYLFCKWCNLTARLELLKEKPLCLFCDLPLVCSDQI